MVGGREEAEVATTEHASERCNEALTTAFGLLGKRWNGMIVGSLIASPAGFSEIRRAVGGMSDSVLADRLAELTAAGLIVREVDPGPPTIVRYRLSESGTALVPVLEALMTWARRHLRGAADSATPKSETRGAP